MLMIPLGAIRHGMNDGLVSQRAWVQKQVLLLTSSSLKLRYSVVLAVKWAEGPLCAQIAVRRQADSSHSALEFRTINAPNSAVVRSICQVRCSRAFIAWCF